MGLRPTCGYHDTVYIWIGLSPRWGSSAFRFYPRLTPWAAFLRRFAANADGARPPLRVLNDLAALAWTVAPTFNQSDAPW